ncbi:MAG: hypothetical protein HKO63_01670 [Acidimicrobiia bacterium]|nr:hypothetical protein [Acidimicrobiia bacterium]MBT8193697.1 hypothetical protein [Acidimicrobiia bacterium]NNF89288.1 hypothetical protein [Acidimicrobiia bacterium]NNL96889.1 hypothetical protein [Acidimicrobiia bacterium]
MSAAAVYELIGYLGSALVVASLSMKSILRLRIVGLAGAVVFCTYATLISAYPIVITNLVIVGIHSYYLRQLLGSKPVFTVLEVRQGSRYLEYFIDHYIDDIRQEFLPDFHYEPKPDRYRAFILRDMVPTGLFICDLDGTDTAKVQLDYVIPAYRDLKVARFLYSASSAIFADPTITHVESPPGTRQYNEYLVRMGYEKATNREGATTYRLRLADLPSQAGRRSVADPHRGSKANSE